uniref:Uncharacterized protein n=1 Tax=Romanomermis culicivorax TaxID=13658 RepID=A0A915KSH0_ROMCU
MGIQRTISNNTSSLGHSKQSGSPNDWAAIAPASKYVLAKGATTRLEYSNGSKPQPPMPHQCPLWW